MNRLLAITILLCSNSFLISKEITKEQAELVAKAFYSKHISTEFIYIGDIKFNNTFELKNNYYNGIYVFNFKKGGFVLISGSDNIVPILGYSPTGVFTKTDHSPDLDTLINKYIQGINESKGNDPQAKTLWNLYTQAYNQNDIIQPKPGLVSDEVQPLLKTNWGQSWPYNTGCPADEAGPKGHAMVGCTALALGQVLKYHNYPEKGYGRHSYYTFFNKEKYGLLSADLGNTIYNWSNMPDTVREPNDDVSTLLYHCGVVLNMEYGPEGSGAGWGNIHDILINYFDYSASAELIFSRDYDTESWESILKNELADKRPIIYAGDGQYISNGHVFILDGYQNNNYFHCNWGWNGHNNGYFILDMLKIGIYDFSYHQVAVIGVKPNDGSTLVGNKILGPGNIELKENLAIRDDIQLTILPNTTFSFEAGTKLKVYGTLQAIGGINDSIKMEPNNSGTGWGGIKIINYNDMMKDNKPSEIQCLKISGVKNIKEIAGKPIGESMGGGLSLINVPYANIRNTRITNCESAEGGGIWTYNSNLEVSNCLIDNNRGPQGGGGTFFRHSTVNLSGNTLRNNTANHGGGMNIFFCKNSRVVNNSIYANNAERGGGLILTLNDSCYFSNNLIYNNEASDKGGGIYYNISTGPDIPSSISFLINNTVCNNIAVEGGGIFFRSSPISYNCIYYGNKIKESIAGHYTGNIISNQVYLDEGVDPSFFYCDVEGSASLFRGPGAGVNYTGEYKNCLAVNPHIVKTTGGVGTKIASFASNWMLNTGSPLINKGTPDITQLQLPEYDIYGNKRINQGTIDIGAIEFNPESAILPGQPQIVFPLTDAINISINPSLKWNSTNAEKYYIQISKNSIFHGTLSYSDSTACDSFSVFGLEPNTKYYWRVKAANVFGATSWSESSFRTIMPLPSVPLLVSPIDGLNNIRDSIELCASSPLAEKYIFQTASDADFNEIINQDTIINSCTKIKNLEKGEIYYWRVQAQNASGFSPFSKSNRFMTYIPSPDSLKIKLTGNNIVELTWLYDTGIKAGFILERKHAYSYYNLDTLEYNVRSYRDSALTDNVSYHYRIRAFKTIHSLYSNEVQTILSGIGETMALNFSLDQNFPNPFNPTTTIRYTIPEESRVKIIVLNPLGKKVAELVNAVQTAGYYENIFNASKLPSGAYIYTISVLTLDGQKVKNLTKKMLLLK